MSGPADIAASTRDGVQVLGLCRFSVPSEGGFQIDHQSIAERRAFLYRPERLDSRFAWFERVTLPALEAQTDPAFRLIVMLGEDFPEPWRSRMEAHAARLPQLVCDYVPPKHHRVICSKAIARHSDPEANFIAQFRMDDDDAVAVDFTQRLRRDSHKARAIVRRDGPVAFDYAKGFELLVNADEVRPVPQHARLRSAGLALFTRPGDGNGVLDNRFAHARLWNKVPVISLVDSFMFVRGIHAGNDSQVHLKGQHFEMEPEAARDELARRFRIDLAAIEADRALLTGS